MTTPFSSPLASNPHYRPDIDGLRAIAVLLVVGFHAFPDVLKGGFVGVDIFFVISGYLISGIILADVNRQRFSVRHFYAKRIRRIFPSLIVVLLACIGFAWFALLPDELKELGKHTAGGAGFVANLVLWGESGYFDSQAELKPLLHLWSLGIEEQFYFIWPLVLVWGAQKPRRLLGSLVALIALSFGLNVGSLHGDPVGTFYSPFTRFWELMVGALLAYWGVLPNKPQFLKVGLQHKTITACIGCLCIAVAVIVLDKDSAFPGTWALLPVLGAFLLIFAGTEAMPNRKILAHPAFVFVGLISFPLYLWHWPLLSFARIMVLGMPTPMLRMGLVLASLALAGLTYRLVEQPIRFGSRAHRMILGLCGLLFGVGVLGYGVYRADGFPVRMQDKVEYSLFFAGHNYTHSHNLIALERHECNFYDIEKSAPRGGIDSRCYTPQANKKLVFLWGDSHAQHLNYGLAQNLPAGVSLLQAGASGCPPRTTSINPNPLQTCNQANQFVWHKIQALKPAVVILAQQRGHENNDYDTTIDKLKAVGVQHVVLVGPVPQWQPFLYKIMLRQHWADYPSRLASHLDASVLRTDQNLRAKYSASKDVTYVSLVKLLCNPRGCMTYLNGDRKEGLITYDYGHFTLVASNYVAKDLLMPVIRDLLLSAQ